MSDDLIAFLHARLNEDEQAARAAAVLPYGAAEWFTGAEGSVLAAEPSQLHVRGAVLSLDDIGEHIAHWDPARVLAEVEAKRRILDEHQPIHEYDPNGPVCSTCGEQGAPGDEDAVVRWPCRTVRLLGSPHAAHPDYREEWRPA